jgi:hypothetical protein
MNSKQHRCFYVKIEYYAINVESMWKHKSSSGASHTNTWRCDDDFAAKEAVVEIVVAVVFVGYPQ